MNPITVPQVIILRQFLQLEIDTNMRMSRHETALHAFTRLTGVNPGRGKKGRQIALRLLEGYTTDVADYVSELDEEVTN